MDLVKRGFLPEGVTNQTDKITSLWTGSWIAALIVGVIVWALIIWCVIAYRKRKNDTTLPVQLRYHVPLEIMYVVLPLFMIGVLYFFTARDQAEIQDTSAKPDVVINVVGRKWNWDFNYVTDNVYKSGDPVELDGASMEDKLPVLYLPVGERVEFVLTSRDVIHSFWVPSFLYKEDLIPGHTNTFQIVPEKEGTYEGKCAELCGEHHADMLFSVKIVSVDEYARQMQLLRDAGNTGQLDNSYDPAPQGVKQ